MEWSNEWVSDRRYLDMTDLNKTCDPYHEATFPFYRTFRT